MNARSPTACRASGKSGVRGFTMVELMIAMLLGLIVIAGVGAVFIANVRSYHTTQALSTVQSSARVAFELMARDIRQAGLTGCNRSTPIANVLNGGPNALDNKWWAKWTNAVRGYDQNADDPAVTSGTAKEQRVASTDSLELLGAVGTGLTVVEDQTNAANFKVNTTSNQVANSDIIIVCSPTRTAILQVNKGPTNNVTVEYNTGKGTPGNCSKGLGYPTDCSSANGNADPFNKNARIFAFGAYDWYIGNNPVKGRSLYRIAINGGGVTVSEPQEMVRNVTDMQITYHEGNNTSFETASLVGDWSKVNAVRVTLTVESTKDNVTTNGVGNKLTRKFTFTTTIRNRV